MVGSHPGFFASSCGVDKEGMNETNARARITSLKDLVMVVLSLWLDAAVIDCITSSDRVVRRDTENPQKDFEILRTFTVMRSSRT